MEGYISNLRTKFDHPTPKKPQHLPNPNTPINYVAKFQYTAKTPRSLLINNANNIRIQKLVGAIQYYDRAVGNKLLVALSELSQKQY